MGNRATIEVKDWDGDSAVCYLYIHWLGDPDQVVTMVKKAAPIMRKCDPDYAMARLIGMYHQEIEGGLSVAVTNRKEKWDNGHYVVDMRKGTIKNGRKTFAKNLEFGNF